MDEKFLIVGPSWVGDMVMAQSLFKLIKQQNSQAQIDVLAPAWSLPLLERMPEVARGIVMPLSHGQLQLWQRYQLGKNLRAYGYQQAIVLPNSFKSALIPFFARIPKRTGWQGELRWGVLNDVRYLDKKRYPLMIQRFMALGMPRQTTFDLDNSFLPTLSTSAQTQDAVLARYQIERDTRPILALCPGAEFGPAKRWPEEYYAAIANAKLAAGWRVWLLGSLKDTRVTEKIMQLTAQQCVNFTGRTTLVEAIDLLALAKIVVSNDSGLMHIAAAVNTPLVALFGPTSPEFTPPLQQKSKVLQLKLACQPCFQRECPLQHHHCMRNLSPDATIHAIRELV